MSRWPMVRLEEVLSPSTDRILLDPIQTYAQVTARLWGKGLALRGRVKGSEIAAAKQNRVSTNQFVISKIDARHGAFGIVPDELNGAVVSNDFPAFNVDPEKAMPEYIAWATRTAWFIAICKSASEGSTNRVRLKEGRFLAQSIPLPTKSDQQSIVRRLGQAEAAVTARKRSADLVTSDIDATLRAAFSRIVSDAPRVSMEEIAPLVRRKVVIDPDASYPELGVRSFGRGTFHKPSLPGIEVGTKKLFTIEPRDLVFNIVFAWEGAVAVAADDDGGRVGSHRFLTCVPDPNRATAEFLCFWFLGEQGMVALGQASPGGAGRNRTLGIKALQNIKVPVPSLDAQLWFDNLQSKARAAKAAQAEASAHLDQLLPAMLNEMFG